MTTTAKKTAKVTAQFVWPKGWKLFKTAPQFFAGYQRRRAKSYGHGVLVLLRMSDGSIAERLVQGMAEVTAAMEEVKPLCEVDPETKYTFAPATLDCFGCLGRTALVKATVERTRVQKGAD